MKQCFVAVLGVFFLALTALGLTGCGAKATPDNLSNVKPLDNVQASCQWATQLNSPPTFQDGGNLPMVDNGEVVLTPSDSARMCAAARARAGKLSVLSDKQVTKLGLKPVISTEADLGDVYPYNTTFAPLYVSVGKVKKECVVPLLVFDYQGNYGPVSPNLETEKNLEKTMNQVPYQLVDQPASTLNKLFFGGKC